jgi:hypothetical protein
MRAFSNTGGAIADPDGLEPGVGGTVARWWSEPDRTGEVGTGAALGTGCRFLLIRLLLYALSRERVLEEESTTEGVYQA